MTHESFRGIGQMENLTVTYYIVKEVGTWRCLPQPKSYRKGTTSTGLADVRKYPPRLFKRVSDARQALNWWKGGKWFRIYDEGSEKMVLTNMEYPERDNIELEVYEWKFLLFEDVD